MQQLIGKSSHLKAFLCTGNVTKHQEWGEIKTPTVKLHIQDNVHRPRDFTEQDQWVTELCLLFKKHF